MKFKFPVPAHSLRRLGQDFQGIMSESRYFNKWISEGIPVIMEFLFCKIIGRIIF